VADVEGELVAVFKTRQSNRIIGYAPESALSPTPPER
jgi:hypothetical protein